MRPVIVLFCLIILDLVTAIKIEDKTAVSHQPSSRSSSLQSWSQWSCVGGVWTRSRSVRQQVMIGYFYNV